MPIMLFMNSMRNANLPDRTDPAVDFDEEMRERVRTWLSNYQMIILVTAGSYLLQVPQRILFNLLPKKANLNPIPFDSYLQRDAAFAGSVIAVYIIILLFGEAWAVDDNMR